MTNFGAKDFLKARFETRRPRVIAASALLNEPSVGVTSLDLDRGAAVPASVHFFYLVGGDRG